MKPISLFIFQILLVTTICTGQQPAAPSGSVLQKSMIWLSDQPEIRQEYVAFRRSFNLEVIASGAQLEIFADSRYLLWINGKYVLRGPCRFNPKRPGYDVVDVGSYLKPGGNSMVVLVHNYGGELNGHIMKHVPGFTARLSMNGREILRTGPDWRCNGNTRYRSSPGSWNTVPDVIDARIDDAGWISPDFDDSSWPHAVAIDGTRWGTLVPREIPLPMETELKDLRLLPSGERVADVLPVELTEGQEMLVDLGQMSLAYTEMDLDAEEGSQLAMRYALRYRNGRPAEMYGDGNRYTARAGRQAFITTDQWGSHYMLVQCLSGRVRILGIKMTDRRYPFERLGKFTCSDPVLTGLWEMAVKTIEVTSDDGYGSDARERNEWIQDASKPSYFTTRMCEAGRDQEGNRVFSDPRLLKSMLRHAAEAQLPDGRLPATFPTDRGPEDCHFVIDDYSCQWFEALKTYYDATGDREFVAEMWPVLNAQAGWFLGRLTGRGLLLAREYTSFDNPFAYVTCEGATINAFFYQALRSSEYLARVIGEYSQAARYKKAADDLVSRFNEHFWNETEGAYNSAFMGDRIFAPTVHAQLIALHYGLVPGDREKSARSWFMANYKNAGPTHVCNNPDYEQMITDRSGINMPIVYFWVFSELYRMNTSAMDLEVLSEIRRRWTPMVKFQQDAGTLSESFTDEYGEGASESCHNYGSVPAWFLSSWVLGVRMEGPVWEKKLLIEPRLGDLTHAEGVVVTEHGAVPVSWKISADGKKLTYKLFVPEGVSATLHLPRSLKEAGSGNRWTVMTGIRGIFEGSADL